MIADECLLRLNEKRFAKWLNRHSDSNDPDYKAHAVDILREWLNRKMPNLRIGNLFRFDDAKKYDPFKKTIVSCPSFRDVNSKDSRGRPNAALNHYSAYLANFSSGELSAKLIAEKAEIDAKKMLNTGCKRVVSMIYKKRF